MAENTEALGMIKMDIQDQAELVITQIQAEVKQIQEEEIHFFSDSLAKEVEHYREKEISELELLQATKTSQAKLKIKRDLLARRQAMAEALFSEVAAALDQFAAGSDYPKFLAEKLAKHADLNTREGYFTVREADTELMQKLLAKSGLKQPLRTEALRFGGFKFISLSEGIEIDETLDNAVRAQKEWFQNNSGFTL